jgi:chromosomal replication initiator protein
MVMLGAPETELRLRMVDQAVVRRQALVSAFEPDPDVLQMIAAELTRTGREVEAAVTHLYSEWANGRRVFDPDSVKKGVNRVLRELEPGVRVEDVVAVVSEHFGVPATAILARGRRPAVVRARQVAMYLAAMVITQLSEIGYQLGGCAVPAYYEPSERCSESSIFVRRFEDSKTSEHAAPVMMH